MSEIQRGLQAIHREPANVPIIQRFTRFFIAAAVLPILTYFITLHLTRLSPNPIFSPNILAGIAAVLTLNIITASFALLAVKEPSLITQSPLSSTTEQEREKEE